MNRLKINNLDIIPMLEMIDDAGNLIRLKTDKSDDGSEPLLLMRFGLDDDEFYFSSKDEVKAFCKALNEFSDNCFN